MHTLQPADPAEATLTVALQPATTADIALLLSWMADFYAHEHIPFDPAASKQSLLELFGNAAFGRLFVLVANGRPVGYAALVLSFSLEFGGRAAFLDELYVQPDARGLGVGSIALRLIQEHSRQLGAQVVALEVHNDNKQADALYRREGFVYGGRRLLTRRL
jgi:ribosomal protein S18 acetylase RimI-like enzyme